MSCTINIDRMIAFLVTDNDMQNHFIALTKHDDLVLLNRRCAKLFNLNHFSKVKETTVVVLQVLAGLLSDSFGVQ